MEPIRFALGIRMPAENAADPAYRARQLTAALKGVNLSGLTLWGGEEEGIFTFVIMGGGLSQMRKVHRAILANGEFMALLASRMPFIENNRITKLQDMAEYSMGI